MLYLVPQKMGTDIQPTTWQHLIEIELTYKIHHRVRYLPPICSSLDCYKIALRGWHPGRIGLIEELKVFLVNQSHRLIGVYNASSGGASGTVADARLIFAVALKANAHAIILCHNHPSAKLLPSPGDYKLTRRFERIGKFHGIPVLDHLIINGSGYFSFLDGYLL